MQIRTVIALRLAEAYKNEYRNTKKTQTIGKNGKNRMMNMYISPEYLFSEFWSLSAKYRRNINAPIKHGVTIFNANSKGCNSISFAER
mmetsp:Transcript_409/g.511  ORF Transcript_409/g.511 Transcript_409/m.511 type:complete len:88 (+) Transcript_409:315-578(+)